MSEPTKCPSCGAPEVDAHTPRTVYACGSSDYDQRPGTFVLKCVEVANQRIAELNRSAGPNAEQILMRFQIAEADGEDIENDALPDYLNSRDAIVGAILRRFICVADKGRFASELWEECHTDDMVPVAGVTADVCIFLVATAAPEQLCRAYLAAIK